jgi:GNAT superfamily N-acetyltransferase
MSHPVDIRLLSSEDLPMLYRISRDAYHFNFGHHWEEGGLEVYMDKVFGWELLAAELREPDIHYYVAFVKGVPVAFMKLNLHSSLPGLDPEKGIELDKLYILPDYKGFGIGRRFVELLFALRPSGGRRYFGWE